MKDSIGPVVHWAPGADPVAEHGRLIRCGELLVRWPPESPGEAPTDCFRLGQYYWLLQPGIGGLRFRADRPECLALPAPGVARAWFERFIYDTWLNVVFQIWGRQILHASAAAWQATGDVIAFVGPSGAGKSSMAYGLSRRAGWIQVCDDALAFCCADQECESKIRLLPLSNDARLRPATAAHYRKTGEPPRPIVWPTTPLRLRTLYFLSGDEHLQNPSTITPLRAAESYSLLLQEAHAFTLTIPEHNQRLMRDYLGLAAAVPAFRLSYRKSFDVVEHVFDCLEVHVGVTETAARRAPGVHHRVAARGDQPSAY